MIREKILLKNEQIDHRNIQVLLLHGYTGSPHDLSPIANALKRKGCQVLVPLLKGHGTNPKDLYHVEATDWLNEASHHLSSFDFKKPIVLGGLSMGTLLALILASRHDGINALLLFSAALWLKPGARAIIKLAEAGLINKYSSLPKLSGGSDINDPKAKLKSQAYQEMPIFGLIQFDYLRVLAINAINQVKSPCFIAFGTKDSTININKSHDLLAEQLNAPYFCRYYNNSKHVITLDYDKNKISHDAWQFLQAIFRNKL
jgi:carboxylesterase